jgi:hypothetical protein
MKTLPHNASTTVEVLGALRGTCVAIQCLWPTIRRRGDGPKLRPSQSVERKLLPDHHQARGQE